MGKVSFWGDENVLESEDVMYIHNRILLTQKQEQNLPFAATLIDLKGIKLSEIRQRKTKCLCCHLCDK